MSLHPLPPLRETISAVPSQTPTVALRFSVRAIKHVISGMQRFQRVDGKTSTFDRYAQLIAPPVRRLKHAARAASNIGFGAARRGANAAVGWVFADPAGLGSVSAPAAGQRARQIAGSYWMNLEVAS